MNDYHRTVAIHVDEQDPGSFFWVLMECTEDATIFNKLAAAKDPLSTWEAALDAGVTALKSLAQDRATGPRNEVEDEDADPVG